MKWKRNDKEIEEPILEYLESIFDEELNKVSSVRGSIGQGTIIISNS